MNNLSYCCKSIDFERLKASKGIKTLIIAFVSKTGQLVAHYRHRIFSFGVLYQRPNIFRHFTGLTMLRERPFDIYTGQEDVLGLVIFFFHDTILSFYFYVIRYSYCPKIIQSVQFHLTCP